MTAAQTGAGWLRLFGLFLQGHPKDMVIVYSPRAKKQVETVNAASAGRTDCRVSRRVVAHLFALRDSKDSSDNEGSWDSWLLLSRSYGVQKG